MIIPHFLTKRTNYKMDIKAVKTRIDEVVIYNTEPEPSLMIVLSFLNKSNKKIGSVYISSRKSLTDVNIPIDSILGGHLKTLFNYLNDIIKGFYAPNNSAS